MTQSPDDSSKEPQLTAEEVFAILQRASEIHNMAETARIDWTRQMMTLSTAALTALIALQDNFVPKGDVAVLWLLWTCWIFLVLTIAMCAVILHGVASMYRQAANQKVETIKTPALWSGGKPHWLAEKAEQLLPVTLLVSAVSLCSFAIANSCR